MDKLESGDIDIAFTVTDAFMVGKSKGRNVKLIGTYVESPLIWAVAASVDSSLRTLDDIKYGKCEKLRIGVSRIGSGSHSMAYYMCLLLEIDPAILQFEVCQNIDGLVKGIHSFIHNLCSSRKQFNSQIGFNQNTRETTD